MICFLNARGYTLLPPSEVKLDITCIRDVFVKSKKPQKLVFDLEKAEMPFALTCVLNGMLFVHVIKKKNNEQAFFLVACQESGVIGKPSLTTLLAKCTAIAHTIIVLNVISPQAKSLQIVYHETENKKSNLGELILKTDILKPKLRSKHMFRYQILNEDEIKALEKKYSANREKFLWMYEQDATARYYGFERGMVLRVLEPDITYRLVVENSST